MSTGSMLRAVLCATIVAVLETGAARAADEGCAECHAKLTQKPYVHAVDHSGCRSCHADVVDGVNHGPGGKPAVRLADSAALCADCHERSLFEGKYVHAPAAEGKCLGCHDPHASDNPGLLKMPPAVLCLDCHGPVKKSPHVVAGFSQKGHPLGDGERYRKVGDPLRPGKPFYCVSCHEPHRSQWPVLLRWDGHEAPCQTCHKK